MEFSASHCQNCSITMKYSWSQFSCQVKVLTLMCLHYTGVVIPLPLVSLSVFKAWQKLLHKWISRSICICVYKVTVFKYDHRGGATVLKVGGQIISLEARKNFRFVPLTFGILGGTNVLFQYYRYRCKAKLYMFIYMSFYVIIL
jgi:hypothetical protein